MDLGPTLGMRIELPEKSIQVEEMEEPKDGFCAFPASSAIGILANSGGRGHSASSPVERTNPSNRRYGALAPAASRSTKPPSTSALASDTATHCIPEPVSVTTLKPRNVRCDKATSPIAGRTNTSTVCSR